MKETFVQQEAEQQSVQVDVTTGAQLATLRNALGWSVEQVAEQLKLAPRQIVAIEQNDFAALPGMAIARGFIRAYAKLLKTDAAPLLAALPGEPPAAAALPASRPDLSAPFSETRLPFMHRRGGPSKSLFGAAVLAMILIALLAVFALGWRPALLEPIFARLNKPTPVAAAPATPMTAEKTVQIEIPQAASKPPALAGAAPSAPASVPAPVEPNAAALVPPTAASGTATPEAVPAKKNDVLVLTLHQDSWVQIRRANGSTLVSRLLRAGATESFEITEPVLLTIGNVSGVEATLRGAPLELKPKNNSNTVRLKLE